jgi:hypothetical protein
VGARYGFGTQGTVTAIASAQADINAIAYRVRLFEFGLFLNAATACRIGLGFSSSLGTPTAGVAPLAYNPADPFPSVRHHVTWSAQPGVPAKFLRIIDLPAVIGAGWIWRWPENAPLIIPKAASLVMWNITAAPLINFYYEIEE